MQTRGRALYNLIRMNWQENPTTPVKPWQVEDYRAVPTEDLFQRLAAFNIPLNETHFKAYVEGSDSPEDLAETLFLEEGEDRFEQVYLLIFELWRRLASEKESLSTFCDELDHLIDLYDQDLLENKESLIDALSELERVLDEHADQGEEPTVLFEEIALYCAHDLESFIYDFASEEIDEEDPIQGSEIIEGFAPYIADKKWFEFLRLRLLAMSNPEEAETMLARILEEQEEDPDFELLLDIARFLVHQGEAANFARVVKQTRHLLETEQDFQELLAITFEFYRLLDRDQEMEKVGEILSLREGVPLSQEIASSDELFQAYFRLIEDLDRSEA